MNDRIALIGMVVGNRGQASQINAILTEYGEHIVGRMGLPYKQRGISVISVVVDAPQNTISCIAGKLGMIDGVSIKTVFAPS